MLGRVRGFTTLTLTNCDGARTRPAWGVARRCARRREQGLRSGDDDTLARLGSDDPPVGADLEQLERQAAVRLALTGIPERCRRLLSALYYEDPPPAYAELAHRLGVPVGSLGPTRARCMEKLREQLAGAAGGGITEVDSGTSADVTGHRPRTVRPRTSPDDPGSPAEKTR